MGILYVWFLPRLHCHQEYGLFQIFGISRGWIYDLAYSNFCCYEQSMYALLCIVLIVYDSVHMSIRAFINMLLKSCLYLLIFVY